MRSYNGTGWLACVAVSTAAMAGDAPATSRPATMEVFVTIEPQAALVRAIAGEQAGVSVLVGTGQDAHTYEPTPRQVMTLGRARVYFTVGLPLESRLVEKITGAAAGPMIVDTTAGITRKPMVGQHHHGHRHEAASHDGHDGDAGDDHANDQVELDPHVWLSPPLLKVQAGHVARAMAAVDPPHAADYQANLGRLLARIDAVDAKVRQALAPYKGQSFYVFHPAFGYFADAYGLTQRAVEVEGKSPTPRQLSALIEQAKADGVQILFVQPQFDPRSAQVVAQAIGGAVLRMDPLAPDVLGNFEVMADAIQKAFDARGGK